MFDLLNVADCRLVRESLESRAAELRRQLHVLKLRFEPRKLALADLARLDALIEEVNRTPKPRTIVPSTVEGYLAATD